MIISAVLLLVCAGMGVACAKQHGEIQQAREREAAAQAAEDEANYLRGENVRCRREAAALQRALEAEQDYSDSLSALLDEQDEKLNEARKRIERAEARRSDAEKDIYASRMRVGQLEKQLREARQEQINQENIYQDILRERDETIARLQENPPKRRTKKKNDALDQQVTLNDILEGWNG